MPDERGDVWVVDDDRDTRDTIGEVLGAGGYACRLLTSGFQLLHDLERPPLPGLVVLDVMMPEMDGVAALKRLRRCASGSPLWRARGVPVLVLTAANDRAQRAAVAALGAEYVSKPIPFDELLERVGRLVGR